ncbi:hypothetical protein [Levilactobacillus namurensis]|uniref:Uncharacterized protein n=1 Tax=Levilactobacillus namurensis TaxID=380393 RepID=A0AAW8W4H0_9LACO|nr:hypothetical protein [Levilactobacillus namurensis]MDT7013316.1 hypothetical protein [Levilactobacillus namurensis]
MIYINFEGYEIRKRWPELVVSKTIFNQLSEFCLICPTADMTPIMLISRLWTNLIVPLIGFNASKMMVN